MSSILQGTTPSLKITIDTDDFAVSDVTALELVFLNCGNTVTHDLEDVTLDTVANTVTYTFTEAETLALEVDYPLYYQLRFVFSDGSIIGTAKARLKVTDLISEEALSE